MVWRRLDRIAAGLVLLLALMLGPARAQTEVDLALVIAVDISYSMDPEEQALQREGFAEAFRSPLVHDAIRRGVLGKIAVVYVEWAGANDQQVIIPWSVLDNPESILGFADKIASTPLRRAQRTSLSGAIDFSVQLHEKSGFETPRRVVDISGDGPNNQGRLVVPARDEAVAKGITINGLPLMLMRPNIFDVESLDIYYRDCVIGGPGAFMIPIRRREQFAEAIRDKLIREITGLVDEPEIIPVQVEQRSDCLKRVD
jgi:hypothetical protein